MELLAQLILRCAENPPCCKIGEERPVEAHPGIFKTLQSKVSLEQLAQIANLSSSHLNRSFHKTFGMPPHAYQIHKCNFAGKTAVRKRVVDQQSMKLDLRVKVTLAHTSSSLFVLLRGNTRHART